MSTSRSVPVTAQYVLMRQMLPDEPDVLSAAPKALLDYYVGRHKAGKPVAMVRLNASLTTVSIPQQTWRRRCGIHEIVGTLLVQAGLNPHRVWYRRIIAECETDVFGDDEANLFLTRFWDCDRDDDLTIRDVVIVAQLWCRSTVVALELAATHYLDRVENYVPKR